MRFPVVLGLTALLLSACSGMETPPIGADTPAATNLVMPMLGEQGVMGDGGATSPGPNLTGDPAMPNP